MSALDDLRSQADPERAAKMRAYHKTDREVLGLCNPQIDAVVRQYRATPGEDLALALDLWQSGIYEARIATGKLLTRGRLAADMDQQYWQSMLDLAPDFDGWAIADHLSMAAHKRILTKDGRFMDLTSWTQSTHLWTKRAAMIYTLPFARLKNPDARERDAIEIILDWAGEYADDPRWFIQKSVAWWLREFSKKNPERAREFLEQNGESMKPFARRDASKYLAD